jgi:cytochrome c-type biogenesis protein CcmH/NrfG
MNAASLKRVWLKPAAVLVAMGLAATVYVISYIPPLTPHVLRTKPNSAVTEAPVPLAGLAALPTFLDTGAAGRRWEIVGGAMLQLGLTGIGVSALRQAVDDNPDSLLLRTALGEALVLAQRGRVSAEAKGYFDTVLATDPNDLVARFYIGLWLLQNGKPKPALVKWVGLMRTVGNDTLWYDRLWDVMPAAAVEVGVSPLALKALCVAGM